MSDFGLSRILGIWGEDIIKGEDNLIHAEDYYCVRCEANGKMVPAVSFWPRLDRSIMDFPYCESCISTLTLSTFGEGPGDKKQVL